VGWTADDFAGWLVDGLDVWHADSPDARRELAFKPAVLDPDQPLLPQVTDEVARLSPSTRAVFRRGLVRAVASWTLHFPQSALRDLALLASSYKPVGMPEMLANRILQAPLGAGAEGDATRARLFRALCAFDTPEVPRLLERIRASEAWRPALAATYLRRQVAADPLGDWLGLMRGLKADFDALETRAPPFALGTTLSLLIADVGGLRRLAWDLPWLEQEQDSWIIDGLFWSADHAIRMWHDRDRGWILEKGAESLAVPSVLAGEPLEQFETWARRVTYYHPAEDLPQASRAEVKKNLKTRLHSFVALFGASNTVLQGEDYASIGA
jgi:hypothetical protein